MESTRTAISEANAHAARLLCAVAMCACTSNTALEDGGQPAPAEDWEPCRENSDCASNLCGPERGPACLPNECVAGCPDDTVCADYGYYFRCESPAARGERCSYFDDLRETYNKACAGTLDCAVVPGSFVTEGYCVPPSDRLLEEPCDDTSQCSAPLICARPGRCLLPQGETCTTGEVCASTYCSPTNLCAANDCRYPTTECEFEPTYCGGGPCGRTCVDARDVGEVCAVDDEVCPEEYACAAGLRCNESGHCEPAG